MTPRKLTPRPLAAAATALALAAGFAALPAAAQSVSTPSVYGNLGYSAVDSDDATFGALGGRLGARLHPNFGVEGEAALGVKGDETDVAGTTIESELKHSVAVYGVGFAPMTEQFDLLARVGYGQSKVKASAAGFSAEDADESWNYGVGAQYSFDGANGVRVDWTRHDFGDNGGDADAWTVSYVRTF